MFPEPLSSLILASASPQRRAILERLGVAFTVRPADVAELEEGDPAQVAVENALRKARAVYARRAISVDAAGVEAAATPVLGVDTVVDRDEIHAKTVALAVDFFRAKLR